LKPCPPALVIPRSEAEPALREVEGRNLLFDKATTEQQIPRTFSVLRACERLGMTKAFSAAVEFFRSLLRRAVKRTTLDSRADEARHSVHCPIGDAANKLSRAAELNSWGKSSSG